MKTIVCGKNELAEKTAGRIADVLREKPDAVLALASGETMRPVWRALAERCRAGGLSLQETRIFSVAELCGVGEEKSGRLALTKGLLEPCGCRSENCFFPDPDTPEVYDDRIDALGGLDLAVLGIGENCHIGYNEPGTLYDTRTHVQKLTERTKRQLLRRGFTDSDMPEHAVTMGIGTLIRAREILLIASGREKSAAVYQMLYAKTTSYIPASFLQIPSEVTVLLDRDAAEKL